jgi:hypothetical protein
MDGMPARVIASINSPSRITSSSLVLSTIATCLVMCPMPNWEEPLYSAASSGLSSEWNRALGRGGSEGNILSKSALGRNEAEQFYPRGDGSMRAASSRRTDCLHGCDGAGTSSPLREYR